jgi:hypothetical protein
MADCGRAGQAFDHLTAGEGNADQTEPAIAMKAGAVERYDAGSFLTAMLQCVEPKCGDCRGRGVAKNPEHAALLAERVAFKIVLELMPERTFVWMELGVLV